MTYELCKELKDAGFPQKIPVFNERWTGNFYEEETQLLKIFSVDTLPDKWVKVPTLSELISACGDEFGSLERTCNYLGKTLEWCATQTNIDGKDLYRIGSTPEEAVARLWLALNKK